ncbi:MAG: glycosyltransferase family 2 protein [Myxococcales bacterium]|nr:glycosyltransferase family 2 protein [Myxococcales bacterium]
MSESPRTPVPEPELSVVIPCLNEVRSVGHCIGRAREAMEREGIVGEVIVVDNGSSDGSIEAARAAGARVVHCSVRGYGAALQAGFAAATGRYVIMGDADGSYDFGELPRLLGRLRQGQRFVMGTRLRGTIVPGAMPLLNRYLGTPVLTALLNALFGTRISDCNCGLRGIERRTLLELGLRSAGMELASEMLIRAAIRGIPIDEVPITLHRDLRDRPPHLRPWRDGWRHLRLLLWFAPDHTMTLPGLGLLGLGLILVVSQLFGPFRIGGLLFDIHYMILGLTLSLLGLSALSMGVAVHAVMPEHTLRRTRILGSVHTWFTFDRAMLAAAALGLLGLVCDGLVLWHWLATGRGPLTPGYTRLTLLGLLLLAGGFQTALLALLVGSARSALAPLAHPDLADSR